MVSPELLRRFPFFGPLSVEQLQAIAMITEEISVPTNTKLFEECQAADNFYLLVSGAIDFTYKSEEEFHPKGSKVFAVGEVNPEEVFGISALIQPYEYSASATTSKDCKVLKTDAQKLRELIESDAALGYTLLHQVAKAAMERLAYTRVQLAAAWA